MEDSKFISWVIATRNRLPLLKIRLEHLMNDILPNEEIIVADGNSTDGTGEWLQSLLVEGRIQGLIREQDRNQAHAWNKLYLAARGKYIKKIIDDDIFDFNAIRQCACALEQYPMADICISDDLSISGLAINNYEKHSRLKYFEQWKSAQVPSFSFGDVHLLIRRTSLPLIGLYDVSFVMIDYEYSLRISYIKAGILYFTGCNALSVSSEDTISSSVSRKTLDVEGIRANTMYEYAGDGRDISLWSRIKIKLGKFRNMLRPKFTESRLRRTKNMSKENPEFLKDFYKNALQILQIENRNRKLDFILGKPEM